MEGMVERAEKIILQADENVSDLRTYHFKKQWKAKKWRTWPRAVIRMEREENLAFLKSPLGTEVRDLNTGEIICELLEHEQEILLLEGGKGAENATFKSSTNQTPRQFTEGKPGMEGEFVFTFKKPLLMLALWGFQTLGNQHLQMYFPMPHPRLIPIHSPLLFPLLE